MAHRIHLIGTPALCDSPAKVIGSVHSRFIQNVNRLHALLSQKLVATDAFLGRRVRTAF